MSRKRDSFTDAAWFLAAVGLVMIFILIVSAFWPAPATPLPGPAGQPSPYPLPTVVRR